MSTPDHTPNPYDLFRREQEAAQRAQTPHPNEWPDEEGRRRTDVLAWRRPYTEDNLRNYHEQLTESLLAVWEIYEIHGSCFVFTMMKDMLTNWDTNGPPIGITNEGVTYVTAGTPATGSADGRTATRRAPDTPRHVHIANPPTGALTPSQHQEMRRREREEARARDLQHLPAREGVAAEPAADNTTTAVKRIAPDVLDGRPSVRQRTQSSGNNLNTIFATSRR